MTTRPDARPERRTRTRGLRRRASSARARLLTAVSAIAVLTVLSGTPSASAASGSPAAWVAASPTVFGLGDSLFMQCGDSLGLGSRSLGMVGWPSATSDDLRARMSSSVTDWPWMTEPSHAAELADFHAASAWVIGLGTNDVKRLTAARYRANVDWFLQQAAGRPVLWFNVHNPQYPAKVAAFNQILADAAQRWPDLHILDWSAEVTAHPEALSADGIHLASYQACRDTRFALIQAGIPPVADQADAPDWTDPAPLTPPAPDPVTAAYELSGGAGGPLGAATTTLDCARKDDGCVQFFANGTLAWSPGTGVHTLPAAVSAAWREHAETGGPGYPTGDAVCTLPGGGCRQQFQTGSMYWSPTTAAFEVNGPILSRYLASGAAAGPLGYPVGGAPCGLAGVGCLQDFQHGSIYWSAGTGAQVLTGAVRSRYVALGAQNSSLGYPTIGTTCNAGGCGQHFQGGSIYGSPAGGARVLTGAVRLRWIAAGATRSGLGYPTVDTACISSGCGQHFIGGSIYWSPSTGAHLLTGPVRALWIQAGGTRSALGYPVAEPVAIPGGFTQRFQHGVLTSPIGQSMNRTPRDS
jgi:hypothetical protein